MNDWGGFQTLQTDPLGFLEDWSADALQFGTSFQTLELSDTLSLTETLRRRLERRTAEDLVLTEALQRRLERRIDEDLDLTGTLQRSLDSLTAETLELTETLRIRLERMVAEDLELDEDTRKDIQKVLTDTVLLGENLDVELIQFAIELSVDDTLTFVEILQRDVAKTLQDVIGLTEDIGFAIARQLGESVQWNEVLTTLKILGGHPDPIVIVPFSERWATSRIIAELFAAGKLLELGYYEPSMLVLHRVGFSSATVLFRVSDIVAESAKASYIDMESLTMGQAHG